MQYISLYTVTVVTQDFTVLLQGPTAASQHMDDLFEVLIESGGETHRSFFYQDAVKKSSFSIDQTLYSALDL